MVEIIFGEREIRFECQRTDRHCVIECKKHPEVFGHPRHLMTSEEKARGLLNAALKEVWGFSLRPLRVAVTIKRPVAGGIADVDRWIISHFLKLARAYSVHFTDLMPK